MRIAKILVVNPYLDVLGGGEKYLLDAAHYLQKGKYEVEIAWPDKDIKSQILSRFGENYGFFSINTLWHKLSAAQRLWQTHQYKYILYQPDGSYFFSLALHNFAFLQVPNQNLLPPKRIFAQTKFKVWQPIFNSQFTKRFFLRHYSFPQYSVLYPMANIENKPYTPKKKMILSVGRFFSHLHSKKQEVLIKAFLNGLKTHAELQDYELRLVGNFKEEDQDYLKYLEKLKDNCPQIKIQTNISHSELDRLYTEAQFYWHAAGYNEDEKNHPERMEHFGTTIIEAMASYAVPLAFKGGGPKETILDGKTGFLYEKPAELVQKTVRLIKEPLTTKKMALAAYRRVGDKFGSNAFQSVINSLSES